MLKLSLFTLTLLFLSGCVSSKQPLSSNTKQSTYESKSGYYYALLEKHKDKYIVVSIEDEPYEKLTKPNQEILKISNDYKDIDLYFTHPLKEVSKNSFECKPKANIGKYNQCTSDFSLSHLTPDSRYIDYQKLNSVIEKSDIIKIVERYRLIGEHQVAFYELKTIQDCDDFIAKYSSIPQQVSLVAKAKELRGSLEAKASKKDEQEMANGGEEKIVEHDEISHKRVDTAATKEKRAMNSLNANLQAFRGAIAVGSQTNCGEVLELKDKKAKILKDKNYYWIETDRLFPKNHGCVFNKGRYIPPPSF